MTHTVTFNSELSVVQICVSGDFCIDEGGEILQEALDLVKQYDCRLVLDDLREANLRFSITELFMLPKLIQEVSKEEGLPFQLYKRAVVAKIYSSNLKFAENVLNNRGHTMKVFTNLDEALKWLQG